MDVSESSIGTNSANLTPADTRLVPSANRSLDRFAWAEHKLAELLPNAPSAVVCDIGAGAAPMRRVTEELGGKWLGFDLVPANDAIVRWDLDFAAPSAAAPAGIVLLLEVLEHLRNPWRAMQHVSDLLLPGGHLLLTTPNPRWSRSRMHALAFGVPACFTESDLANNHHVFTAWPHVVARIFSDTGLELVAYETLDGRTELPGRPYDHRYPVRLALSLLNRYVERRDSSACGMAYGMVARKRLD